MSSILSGYKTYLTGIAMIAYAAVGYFLLKPPNTLTEPAALQIVFAAFALMGLRSGVTTEVSKLLAALGVNVLDGNAATPKLVQQQPNSLGAKVDVTARKIAAAASVFLLYAVVPAIALLSLVACSTATDAPKTVAQIEIAYTPVAGVVATAINGGVIKDAGTIATLKELNDAIDTKGADGQQHGLLVAARAAAQSGDSVLQATELDALQQAVTAFTAYAASKGITAK